MAEQPDMHDRSASAPSASTKLVRDAMKIVAIAFGRILCSQSECLL